MSSTDEISPRSFWLTAAVLLLVGICLRWGAATGFQPADPEEIFYGRYVELIAQKGIGAYPDLVEQYLVVPPQLPTILPPLRVGPILGAVAIRSITGADAPSSLNREAAAYSILLLPLALLAARRLAGPRIALATLAFLAVAPTQLFAARHGFLDVVLAFWVLAAFWALWECLQKPVAREPLVVLGFAVAMLVLTRETWWIAVSGLLVPLALNRWLKFGTWHRNIAVALGIGVILGVAFLALTCGGVDRVIAGYQRSLFAAAQFPYTIATADGPWYRYLFDLTIVSPLIVLLAITMVVRLNGETRPQLFAALFFAVSYILMAAMPYGANLRFASFWDFPLCFLAASAILGITASLAWRPVAIAVASLILVAASSLQQYRRIFLERNVYETTTPALLKAVDILK